MGTVVAFIGGLMIGGTFGILTAAILVAGKDDEDDRPKFS